MTSKRQLSLSEPHFPHLQTQPVRPIDWVVVRFKEKSVLSLADHNTEKLSNTATEKRSENHGKLILRETEQVCLWAVGGLSPDAF